MTPESALESYVGAFIANCRHTADSDTSMVARPGLCGQGPAGTGRRVRLLALDDRAVEVLAAMLPDIGSGMVNVLQGARLCTQMMVREREWQAYPVVPMVCDLAAVPDLPLPDGLTLRAVRRRTGDPAAGVALLDAVAVANRARPEGAGPYEGLVEYLQELPAAIRLYAATDEDGVPRATSGCGAFGAYASVLFVNTDPGWRNRGVAAAMTAAALNGARLSGARLASLDASSGGVSVYARLGFTSLAPITRFVRVP